MSETVLECRGLTKRYDGFVAVKNLDMAVEKGEVFGLLGPNGAGKTTTILMLLGLTEPTEGSVRVLGLDPARRPLSVKARVGYLPESVGFYEGLTAYENLTYIARLNGLRRHEAFSRIDAVLDEMGLTDAADQPVATFSRGMRQRLGVADVLIKRPQLVIMDEPTQGLDPDAAREFLRIVQRLKDEGITILLASHQLQQVQAVCERVGLFHQGHLVLEGTISRLARQVLGGAYRVRVEVDGPADLEDTLSGLDGVLAIKRPSANTYSVEALEDLRPEAARAVVGAGGRLLSLDVETPDLDDVYARYFEQGVNNGRG